MAGRPKKVIKGGLSHEEKGRIIFLLKTLGGESEENYTKIAEDLKRSVDSVKKAVQEMKDALGIIPKVAAKVDVIKKAIASLVSAGLSKKDAQSRINRVLSTLTKEQQESVTDKQIHASCINLIGPNDLFVTKTGKGNPGVTINNEAASTLSDSLRPERPKNPNIYKIFEE